MMRWIGTQEKPQLSVHLYTPQITVTSGSNSNLLLGYVALELCRPTSIKSIKLALSGVYSASWVENAGPNRKEYFQNKQFHSDSILLSRKNLTTRNNNILPMFQASNISNNWGSRNTSAASSIASRSRSNSSSSERLPAFHSRSSSRHQNNYDIQEELPQFMASDNIWDSNMSRRNGSDDSDNARDLAFEDIVSQPKNEFGRKQMSTGAQRDEDEDSNCGVDLAVGFELPAGKHQLKFCFTLPSRMPSTIVSHVGGIDYNLVAQMKLKNSMTMLPGNNTVSATCPVHVTNLPSRFAQLEVDLPVNDEAVFTKQMNDEWWIMSKLSARTASPGDILSLDVSMAWPGQCAYDEDLSSRLEIVAIQMDLIESTVYKSLSSGKVIKKIEVVVASGVAGGLSNDIHENPRLNSLLGDSIIHKRSSEMDLLEMSRSRASSKSSRESSQVDITSAATPAVQGMFNDQFKRTFKLQVPKLLQSGVKLQAGGIHIDCRSAPVSIIHEVQVTIQVLDIKTQKLHTIPFFSRILIVPEAESLCLPAYNLSVLDTRVM
ncbi:hypothetical protein BX661DRAFT_187949 [Kickxella alabastrina]|uniref:uncharacterized protein n=1 Tax=Kickxella alabastrina TaxID=61397 RepID=UPI00221F5AA7|nr:uncharacterized protein BX661DRAFT_187949 [Kickxella alabastrina]KAI7821790.1 hypothetical protein BX661DRAFT_187949 [Kickxella alabastrina]